jgi:diguanylate cyclase (GGDEF)-like protein
MTRLLHGSGPKGDTRRGSASVARVERLVLALSALSVVAILGVGAIGIAATNQLQQASAHSSDIELAVSELDAALIARTGIDTDILQVATGEPMSTESLLRPEVTRAHLEESDRLLVAADASPELLADFRTMAGAMNDFVTTAADVIDEIAVDVSTTPAHLTTLHQASIELDSRLAVVSERLGAANLAAREATAAVTMAAKVRTGVAAGISVVVLIAIAALMARRIAAAFAGKDAAETATDEATGQLKEQLARQEFASDLREALENADDESDAIAVAGLALTKTDVPGTVELLLADSSRAHLQRAVATDDRPGCGVASPWDCPAVRGGRTLVFDSSEALRACPHLRGREGGELSAVCTPLLFSGRGIGVVHAFSSDGSEVSALGASEMATVASEVATRIGTIRVLAKNSFQAKTDGLTGMINRRRLEEVLRELTLDGGRFSLVMADLDHFKLLNDAFGHEAGDRALRVFARVVSEVLRAGDTAGRYGGEEFVFVLPDLGIHSALDVVGRLRAALRTATQGGACPDFTASFGIAEWAPGMTVDALLRSADARLLAAKAAGRDRAVIEGDGDADDAASDVQQDLTPLLVPTNGAGLG